MGRQGGADRLYQGPRAAGARRLPPVLHRSQRSVTVLRVVRANYLNEGQLIRIRRDSRVVQLRGHVDPLPDLPRLRRLHQEERRILRRVRQHVHRRRLLWPERQLRRPRAVLRRGLLPGDGHRHLLQRRLHRRSRREHGKARAEYPSTSQ